ncbi:hypothetical protein ACO0LM_10465 [Undibacterium sp. Di26W]|uniref:hypothetical protein n=1 Tax=Undibacterium sp. Di26W TaxID=3413035 RepID=UPI003BF105FA
MFKVSIKSNFDQVIAKMPDFPRNQLPYALATALTKTAQEIAKAKRKELQDVFDRPTPYTLDSLYVKPARKNQLSAYVGIKDFSAKGTPAIKFLSAQIDGGTRHQKRFERALQAVGALPSGYYVVPGSAARLDSYGNIDRGLIVQLLSYFKAFPEMGYKANMTDKRKAALAKGNAKKGIAGVSYFVGSPGSRLPLGIWSRHSLGHGSAVKPVLIFVRSAHFKALLDFYYVSEITVKATMDKNIRAAIEQALKTQR